MDTIIVDFSIVNAVIESWIAIKCSPNYEQVAGEILFRKIFELAPVALAMYPFGDEFRGREAEMYKSEVFQRHAKGVVRMLDEAVNMLGPDLDPVTRALTDLGARHVAYGVVPAHYGIVGEALIHTLSTALGEGWTKPVAEGWTAVYEFVSTAMIEGANRQIKKAEARRERLRKRISQAQDKLQKTQKNSVGEHVPAQRRLKAVPGLANMGKTKDVSVLKDKKQVSALIDDVLNMSISTVESDFSTECADPADDELNYCLVVESVYRSWDKIKAIPDYEKVAGVLLFKKIFEIAPGAKALYSFYDSEDPSMQEESFYEHPSFLRHAVAVVRMLDAAVHMLGPHLDPVTAALEGLGARHVHYGVIADHYPIVGEALLSTLEAALGDAWTSEVKMGWTTIFSFVSTTMIKGANAATTKTASSTRNLNGNKVGVGAA